MLKKHSHVGAWLSFWAEIQMAVNPLGRVVLGAALAFVSH
jgi:hypothetical protein